MIWFTNNRNTGNCKLNLITPVSCPEGTHTSFPSAPSRAELSPSLVIKLTFRETPVALLDPKAGYSTAFRGFPKLPQKSRITPYNISRLIISISFPVQSSGLLLRKLRVYNQQCSSHNFVKQTTQLNPQSIVLTAKLTVIHLVKLSTFYGTRSFIVMFSKSNTQTVTETV
jgi:hypothetical protein